MTVTTLQKKPVYKFRQFPQLKGWPRNRPEVKAWNAKKKAS
jgi:hypothetical protein